MVCPRWHFVLFAAGLWSVALEWSMASGWVMRQAPVRHPLPTTAVSNTGRAFVSLGFARDATVRTRDYPRSLTPRPWAGASVPVSGTGGLVAQSTQKDAVDAGVNDGRSRELSAATGRMVVKGPVVDMLTPFTREGDVDFPALGAYLQFLSRAGVKTVLCNGRMGEFASLTVEERKSVAEFTRNAFTGTVLNQISSSALPDVTSLISHSSGQCGGGARRVADAVVVMPPLSSFAGVDVDEGGIETFFRRALRDCELPVFLYSTPAVPISPITYARLCADFPTVSGILDGGEDLDQPLSLKAVLPARQLLVSGERRLDAGRGGDEGVSKDGTSGARVVDGVAALKAGADACVVGASNPLPEVAVRLQECFERGDISGAGQAQRRLDVWAKKCETVSGALVPVVKAAVAARVAGFNVYTRPPFVDLDRETAGSIMRWVLNNDDVIRVKQKAHISKVSSQLSEVYRRVWSAVEVSALEMLLKQLTDVEDNLMSHLERARRQQAVAAGEAETAKLLSSVMEARHQLEVDAVAGGSGQGGDEAAEETSVPEPSAADVQNRLQEAKALAQKSEEYLSNLNGLAVSSAEGMGDDHISDVANVADITEVMGFSPASTTPAVAVTPASAHPTTVTVDVGEGEGGDTQQLSMNGGKADETKVVGEANADVMVQDYAVLQGSSSQPLSPISPAPALLLSSSTTMSPSADAAVTTSTTIPPLTVTAHNTADVAADTDQQGHPARVLGSNVANQTNDAHTFAATVAADPTSTGKGVERPADPNAACRADVASVGPDAQGNDGAGADSATSPSANAETDSVLNGVRDSATSPSANAETDSVLNGLRDKNDRSDGHDEHGTATAAAVGSSDHKDRATFAAAKGAAAQGGGSGWGSRGNGSILGEGLTVAGATAAAGAVGAGGAGSGSRLNHGGAGDGLRKHGEGDEGRAAVSRSSPTNYFGGGAGVVSEVSREIGGGGARVAGTGVAQPAEARPNSVYYGQDGRPITKEEAMAAASASAAIPAPKAPKTQDRPTRHSLPLTGAEGGSDAARASRDTRVTRAGDVVMGKRGTPLPTPRYGRHIPEGSPSVPPQTPKTLPRKSPFIERLKQETRRTASGALEKTDCADSVAGANGQRGAAAVREDLAVEKRFSGLVDEFREKEKELFFTSKGIPQDVDSFDWGALRRNTPEIESLQRQAVHRHLAMRDRERAQQGSHDSGCGNQRRRPPRGPPGSSESYNYNGNRQQPPRSPPPLGQ